ncbi:MAG: acyl-CoA thioesterase II [Pseudomonadota bacterium]
MNADAASKGLDLVDLLDIEQLEMNLFRGSGEAGETRPRLFGGHVIAQALVAAYRTVEDRLCHSLHAYFIHPGDPTIPIIYEVDRARDGGSFTTRRVIAVQHGRQIFNLAASFHRDETGWNHQHDMPDVPPPEDLLPREEIAGLRSEDIPERHRKHLLRPRPIEIREIDPQDYMNPQPASDVNHSWFRVRQPLDNSPWLHHCLLAYASDMSLLGSGNRRHGVSWLSGDLMGASLDHAMWFHAPLDFNAWHLYTMDSPFAGGARSFNRGMIYTREGHLVASVAQEGMMRPIRKKG